MEEAQPLVGASLIKHLVSCNKTTRDKALRRLNTWLPSQHQVSDDDIKKLWKSLFYCVWHADKAPVQSELINRLSSLLLALDLSLSIDYFSVFLLTMRREWSGIDALRLDKFYLLIRRFVHSLFLLLKKNGWDSELTLRFMGILEERTFFADDRVLGNGVNYHIASVFLDELEPFLPVTSGVLDILFKPFLSVMGKCQDKVLVGKTKNNVFDVLSKMGKSLLESKKLGNGVAVADSGDHEVVLGTVALTMGFSGKFYDLGSSSDCFQGNRKVLFSLHEDFLRLEKDLESSGIEISIPEVKVDDEDEVPKLIPIVTSETEMGASGFELEAAEAATESLSASASKPSKKIKKAKKGSDGIVKKVKAKKNGHSMKSENENENVIIANGESSSNGPSLDGNVIAFNETVISNLQIQFEKVAAEVGLDQDGISSCNLPTVAIKGTISKKRKRVRNKDGGVSHGPDLNGLGAAGGDVAAMSAKKVRFSMKNNLVWKPHSPLPPQSLRLPPSVTPRGSALKQGIPPGPIREIPPATKKVKQKKKGRKAIKTTSPAIKRLRKLKTRSI